MTVSESSLELVTSGLLTAENSEFQKGNNPNKRYVIFRGTAQISLLEEHSNLSHKFTIFL
jgi:hypothetical protein